MVYFVLAYADEDVQRAVEAATRAFTGPWRDTTGRERAVVLRAVAAALVAHKATLSRLECLDSGKPIDETDWDLDDCAGAFEYYAGLAEELDAAARDVDVGMEEFRARVVQEPVGPVALITPWNYPLLIACWKVAAALAAGRPSSSSRPTTADHSRPRSASTTSSGRPTRRI